MILNYAEVPEIINRQQQDEMGRYTKLYSQSVMDGNPKLWVAPPSNIVASDLIETMTSTIIAFGGTWLLVGGIQGVNSGQFDTLQCAAWGGIVAGGVLLAPVVCSIAAEFLSTIHEAWECREVTESESDQPIASTVQIEKGQVGTHIPGAWWYHNTRGELRCYHTPAAPAKGNETLRPIISDQRMITIFSEVERGIPFSERRMCAKVTGLTGPQFRKLQNDWTNPARQLYVIRPDRTGYFTESGSRIAEAIRTTKL